MVKTIYHMEAGIPRKIQPGGLGEGGDQWKQQQKSTDAACLHQLYAMLLNLSRP